MEKIKKALMSTLAMDMGAFVLVDGQYGSTGKGLAASVLAECFHERGTTVYSNAGPNSGHTFYTQRGDKVVLQQLPSFAVASALRGGKVSVIMTAGAVIDIDRITQEIDAYSMFGSVFVHPMAAVVTEGALKNDALLKERLGSTGKGTGAAIAAKVMRDPDAVAWSSDHSMDLHIGGAVVREKPHQVYQQRVVEVSQGFSLSLNHGGFYPYCTSRDCTVGQALSDAKIHPHDLGRTMMVVRTYPIRVAGNSGDCYPDQKEIDWGVIGVDPELTTVTKKPRRIFTWSDMHFMDAVEANRPDYIFLNFMNYLKPSAAGPFVDNMIEKYEAVMHKEPLAVILGYGPLNSDAELYYA